MNTLMYFYTFVWQWNRITQIPISNISVFIPFFIVKFTAVEYYVDYFIHAHQLHDKWNDRISPVHAYAVVVWATATKTSKTPFLPQNFKEKVAQQQHYDLSFPCKNILDFDAVFV